MSQDVKSLLRFNGYTVEMVEFYKNSQSVESGTDNKLDIKLDIQRSIEYFPEKNKGLVTVTTKVFEDPVKNNYPFSIKIVVIGEFEVEAEDDSKIKSFLEINALAILFPYIRALITTYTANANVEPLILPPINILKLVNNDS